MFNLKCDVHIWKSDKMRCVDEVMKDIGSTELVLPWKSFKLLKDEQHFTLRSQIEFEKEFASKLSDQMKGKPSSILVLADSTVGYHDWDGDIWHGRASKRLERELQNLDPSRKIVVHVDAVCGSGFVARSEFNEHFRARMSTKMRMVPWDVVVFVGGWNDEHVDVDRLRLAIQGCRHIVRSRAREA